MMMMMMMIMMIMMIMIMMMMMMMMIMIMIMMILKTSGGAPDRQGYPDQPCNSENNQDTAPYFAPGIQTHTIVEISIWNLCI